MEKVVSDGKAFCCNGCSQVYLLLNENNLCSYYDFDRNPGIKARGKFLSERFEYLEDEGVINKLVQFSDEKQVNVTFRLPQMHCSSCIYLLENLHRIESGIVTSQVNFQKQEVFISFNPSFISLRKVVELLAFIGYEPDINLSDTTEKKKSVFDRKKIYRIGIAGFCFSNIMMLSFPEYFSGGEIEEEGLKAVFTWIIFALSLPVLFFSAGAIFEPAFKGLRQGDINIDVPIALAIVITFGRSYYEIITGTGAGYLDSGTGIIFFMLIGRWFQNKTNDALTFDRDYKAYFPLGVTIVTEEGEKNIPVTRLQKGDTILVRHEEMIPADAVLVEGEANIDYSFVTGENAPVKKLPGDLLYAGGKQNDGCIRLRIVKEASKSYITQLWNNDVFFNRKNRKTSYIHPWSRYFTIVLFLIAITASVYWYNNDPSNIWPAVTATLIVACPCSLLLSATFTYGNMLRVFSRNHLYMKNASVIESLAAIDTVVFDKTGTITQNNNSVVDFRGSVLSESEKDLIGLATSQSSHTLSRAISGSLSRNSKMKVNGFKEYEGQGISAEADYGKIRLGNRSFINGLPAEFTGPVVHVEINDQYKGYFQVHNDYRKGMKEVAQGLASQKIKLAILSGDNDQERSALNSIFGDIPMLFNTSPSQKLEYIKQLQAQNKKVLMVGDGLNDAGALMQANTGIAVSDNAARFTPACDAIIDGKSVTRLDRLIKFARSGKSIVAASFVLSILYNFIGISYAVQAKLSPLIAAILMPASSISIIFLVTLLSSRMARKYGL